MVRALLLDKKNQYLAQTSSPTPAPIKAVEPNCVTCGGNHAYQNCPATNENVYQDNIQEVRDTPSAPMPNLKLSIPYPSERDNERRHDQANEQIEKFYEIFKEMSFEISFTDALMLMPKFASTLKALIGNKEKLSEIARTSMNEHCSACLALADLDASINLMPLFVWKRLSLPELAPTCMTLELTDQTESKPVGIAKDVKVKVEVLGFSDVTASGSPTPSDDPIVSTTCPTLTPFEDSDFLLFEEADAFLGLEDDPDSLELDPSYYDPEGDILSLEASSTPAISSDIAELKDMVRALLLDKKNQSSAQATSHTPAPVKAVESNCVTCGGTHSYQNCPATSGNVYQDNINEYVSQAAAANYNQGNTGFRPQMVAN
nr:reverse transcriptase domain-containing protein [Tanacetum cinerariifolium]